MTTQFPSSHDAGFPTGFFNFNMGTGGAVSFQAGSSADKFAFDIEDGQIVRCGLAFGRKWITCEDKKLAVLKDNMSPAGVIYASVSHPSPGQATLSVSHAGKLPENSLDVSHRALYVASGTGENAVWADVRSGITIMAMS